MAWTIYVQTDKGIERIPGSWKSQTDAEWYWVRLRGSVQGKPIYVETKGRN